MDRVKRRITLYDLCIACDLLPYPFELMTLEFTLFIFFVGTKREPVSWNHQSFCLPKLGSDYAESIRRRYLVYYHAQNYCGLRRGKVQLIWCCFGK